MLAESQFARIKLFSYKAILMKKKPEKFVWLAAIRVMIPKIGMGVEFLDIDPDSTQHCWPGSKIFASRAETCRHIVKPVSHDRGSSSLEAPTSPQSCDLIV